MWRAFFWVANLFMFRRAAILELETDQKLLFAGTTCRVGWKTSGAYRVKLFLNDKFYKSYKPDAVADLPVQGTFRVELIARSIYGNARESFSLEVNYVQFTEIEGFVFGAAAGSQPRLCQSLVIHPSAMLPVTPSPVLTPVPVMLDSAFLVASRESLEQEIIASSYHSEINF